MNVRWEAWETQTLVGPSHFLRNAIVRNSFRPLILLFAALLTDWIKTREVGYQWPVDGRDVT